MDSEYGFEFSGYRRGEREGELQYNYDYKFSLKPIRKISVDELNHFFKKNSIEAYSGVIEIKSINLGSSYSKSTFNFDLNKVQVISVSGNSDFRYGDSKDFFGTSYKIIFEYEAKFYSLNSFVGGSSENCNGEEKCEEISKEEASDYNKQLF